MSVRLTIGEFSKMTYLSVKALRHYHDVGLLEPAEIDPSSGYRRYTAEQVPIAQAIRRFRDLDMPLEQVRTVLQAPDVTTRNQAILDHLDAMQQQLERTQQTVASLQALLSSPVAARPISYRVLPATDALAVRAVVDFDDTDRWLEAALADLHEELATAGIAPTGPDGALYDDAFFQEAAGEVIAYVPAPEPHSARALELPETRVAVMVHDGPFGDLDQTYGALGTAVAELGLGIPGPIREIYLSDSEAEICWPIRPPATGA